MLGRLVSSAFTPGCSGYADQLSVRCSPGCSSRVSPTTDGTPWTGWYCPPHSIRAEPAPPAYSVSRPGSFTAGPAGSMKPNQSALLLALVPGKLPLNVQVPLALTGW